MHMSGFVLMAISEIPQNRQQWNNTRLVFFLVYNYKHRAQVDPSFLTENPILIMIKRIKYAWRTGCFFVS